MRGVLVGTVTIIEDVSDRLASESVLRKQIEAQQLARGMAENALRAKDEFLSTLSHEIRTPLNAVLGWARILIARGEIDRTLLDRALHVIERNATAQARMIDDMLDMARIATGKLRLEMRPVDVVKVGAGSRGRGDAGCPRQARDPADEPGSTDAECHRRSGSAAAGDLESAVECAEVHRAGRVD